MKWTRVNKGYYRSGSFAIMQFNDPRRPRPWLLLRGGYERGWFPTYGEAKAEADAIKARIAANVVHNESGRRR